MSECQEVNSMMGLFRRNQCVPFTRSFLRLGGKAIHGKAINYGGQQVLVSNEVAKFLESDERRQAAQDRSDRRHLRRSDFETVSVTQKTINQHGIEDVAFRNPSLEKLRKLIAALSDDEQTLIRLYFYMDLSMDEVGKHFGISKMAVSNRPKKF